MIWVREDGIWDCERRNVHDTTNNLIKMKFQDACCGGTLSAYLNDSSGALGPTARR